MITGKSINLSLIKSESEIIKINDIYNILEERSLTDHTEIYSKVKIMQSFNENGLWSSNSGSLLITTKEDKIIGLISFNRKTEFELSIGYRIYNTHDRKKGYMTEGLNLFTAYLFKTIPLITRLSLYTAENNIASRKLAEKCGYTQEGLLRNAYFYRGDICNWIIYSVLREEVV